MSRPALSRSEAKAERTDLLLRSASRLFAARGYDSVSIGEVAAEAGVSGPAIYRHFRGKSALLTDILVDISQRLLDGGASRAAVAASPRDALLALLDFHADFSLTEPDRIRIYERELAHLDAADARRVRRLQRRYVDIWVAQLQALDAALDESTALFKVQATIGLLNSTPYTRRRQVADQKQVLTDMARRALAL